MIRRALARLILRAIGPELREAIRAQSVAAVSDTAARGGAVGFCESLLTGARLEQRWQEGPRPRHPKAP